MTDARADFEASTTAAVELHERVDGQLTITVCGTPPPLEFLEALRSSFAAMGGPPVGFRRIR